MNDYFYLLTPEIVLFVAGCLCLFLGLSRRPLLQLFAPWLAILSTIVVLTVFWQLPAPDAPQTAFGVKVSSLTWYVRLVALCAGLLVMLVNVHQPESTERGEYFAMIVFSLAGVMLTAGADDLILLFLALELVSVPTYALVAAASTDGRAQEAGVKYFFLGALAAAVLVYGFSFLYGAAGTTSLTEMAQLGTVQTGSLFAVFGLLLAMGGLAYKIAAVPFYAYAPDVYQGAASPVTGLLGFFPKLAGFVAIIRLLAVVPSDFRTPALETAWVLPSTLFWILWVVSAGTMLVGNCLALYQTNVKRILAYSSIAHSGYMLIAVLVGPSAADAPLRDGWSAMLFYIVTYGVMNLGAFAVLAYVRVQARPAEDLDDIAGLARTQPIAALAMACCLFSLMGMPPTAGFFGKLYVFSGALSLSETNPHQTAMIVLAVIGVLNSAIAAAYYLRIIAACYVREPRQQPGFVADPPLRLGMALCTAFVLLVGVWPRDLFRLAGYATRDLRPPPRQFFVPGPSETVHEPTPPDDSSTPEAGETT